MTFKFADVLLLICSYIIMTCGLLSASFVKLFTRKEIPKSDDVNL